jgi:predicted metal-dependent peptidase
MASLKRLSTLSEAFENRKFKAGTVKFSTTDIKDPHIVKAIGTIVAHSSLSRQDIETKINDKIAQFAPIAAKAPTLYGTIVNNIVEDTVFTMMQEYETTVSAAPKYDRDVFFKLVRRIKAEHDMFNPMRSFLNHKHLYAPVILFVPENQKYKVVTTAAASPKGEFIFNEIFMQNLMDFAHLKEVKPQGKKYVNNGGDIPDEYCYIEFLIIHEFMHYVYDDFHYSKIIPRDANISKKVHSKIINWVGDFRTNYLLVKSGYEQLPMGLFNDAINYDRQKSYIDMYNLVKSELVNMSDEEQEQVEQEMDENSDDHEPGNEEGEEMDEGADGEPIDKIDEQQRKIEKAMKDARDLSPKEARQFNDQQKPTDDRSKANTGDIRDSKPTGIDYTKVKPRYDWKALIKMFLSSADVETEETYRVPSRRSISSIHTAAQIGAGAMKPGEAVSDLTKAKLAFCIDSSGSMSHIIEMIYSNIDNLLKTNKGLQGAEFTLLRFSGNHEMFKGIFAGDKAAKITKVDEKPSGYPLKLSTVFKQHFGDITNFTPDLVSDLSKLLTQKYNVLIFSDSDITNGENFTNLIKLFKVSGGKVFIIFDDRITYEKFRKQVKGASAFITYFDKK